MTRQLSRVVLAKSRCKMTLRVSQPLICPQPLPNSSLEYFGSRERFLTSRVFKTFIASRAFSAALTGTGCGAA